MMTFGSQFCVYCAQFAVVVVYLTTLVFDYCWCVCQANQRESCTLSSWIACLISVNSCESICVCVLWMNVYYVHFMVMTPLTINQTTMKEEYGIRIALILALCTQFRLKPSAFGAAHHQPNSSKKMNREDTCYLVESFIWLVGSWMCKFQLQTLKWMHQIRINRSER